MALSDEHPGILGVKVLELHQDFELLLHPQELHDVERLTHHGLTFLLSFRGCFVLAEVTENWNGRVEIKPNFGPLPYAFVDLIAIILGWWLFLRDRFA